MLRGRYLKTSRDERSSTASKKLFPREACRMVAREQHFIKVLGLLVGLTEYFLNGIPGIGLPYCHDGSDYKALRACPSAPRPWKNLQKSRSVFKYTLVN